MWSAGGHTLNPYDWIGGGGGGETNMPDGCQVVDVSSNRGRIQLNLFPSSDLSPV